MAVRSFRTRNRATCWLPPFGAFGTGFENELHVRERYRVGLESSDRALGEDGFTERHRQPAVVHGRSPWHDFNHLTLFVRDRSTATDWYVQNLNLEVEFEVPETATTTVRDPDDFTIFLMERSSIDDAPRSVLYFEVDDVDAEYQRIRQGGAALAHPPRETPRGYGPEIIDPDGHIVRLWDQRSVT